MVRGKYHTLLPPLFPAEGHAVLCLSKGNLTGLNLVDKTFNHTAPKALCKLSHGIMESCELEWIRKGYLVHQKV